jgi:DHA1 family tetracycline resistance protein-like MFS transporter
MERYRVGPRTVGLAILGLAVIVVFMQTAGVRRLVPRLGEFRLACIGLACWVCGMIILGLSGSLLLVLPGLVLCGLGSGSFTPTGAALASHQSDAGSRGIVIGAYQLGSSLARVLAPLVSGLVFQEFGPGAPYLLGGMVTLQATWCMLAISRRHGDLRSNS